jgi:hypothetical protein
LSWQITPIALTKAVTDPDPAAAKRAFDAMMEMKKIDIAAIEAARRGLSDVGRPMMKELCYALFHCDPFKEPPFTLELGFSDGAF